MVGVATCACDHPHNITRPGIAFLECAVFDGLIVFLLDESRILSDDFCIKTLEGHHMGSRLAGFATQALHAQHADNLSTSCAVNNLGTAQLISNPLPDHIDQPAICCLLHLLRKLVVG